MNKCDHVTADKCRQATVELFANKRFKNKRKKVVDKWGRAAKVIGLNPRSKEKRMMHDNRERYVKEIMELQLEAIMATGLPLRLARPDLEKWKQLLVKAYDLVRRIQGEPPRQDGRTRSSESESCRGG